MMYALIDDIFRFEISVNDFILMHVVKSSAGLTDNIPGHVFGDSSSLLEIAVKLS